MDKVKVFPRFLTRRYGLFRGFLLDKRFLPRWMVLLIDLSICFFSFFISVLIINESLLVSSHVLTFSQQALILLSINLICFILFRSYSGIIRHSTFTDVYKLALAIASSFVITVIVSNAYESYSGKKMFWGMGLLLYAFLSFTFLLAFRVVVKESYRFLRNAASNSSKKRILVFGVNDNSVGLAQSLLADSRSPYRPVAFLSLSKKKLKFKIMDLPVLNCSRSEEHTSELQ